MSPSNRIIPAAEARRKHIESFPYFAASFAPIIPPTDGNDEPIGDTLVSQEEDVKRLLSVEQQVSHMLQEAEREAQEIARRAYEEGFAAGEREGREFGESQYKVHLQRLDSHLLKLAQSASILDKAAKDELLSLAFAMGEYLAAQQLDTSYTSIRPLLESILAAHPFPAPDPANPGADVAVVFLNPRDLEELGDRYVGYPGLRLSEDIELSRGSLRLETVDGVVEATLEQRRERLLAMLRQAREAGL